MDFGAPKKWSGSYPNFVEFGGSLPLRFSSPLRPSLQKVNYGDSA